MRKDISSRISGFYQRPPCDRLATIGRLGVLDEGALGHLEAGGGLAMHAADCMSENVIATHGLIQRGHMRLHERKREFGEAGSAAASASAGEVASAKQGGGL